LEQDATACGAVRDLGGEDHVVHAQYLVGADGARSTVRELIGARMEGQLRPLAPLQHRVPRAGPGQAHRTARPSCTGRSTTNCPACIGPMDSGDKWFFMPTGVPEGAQLDRWKRRR
jgi:hypothetical protein